MNLLSLAFAIFPTTFTGHSTYLDHIIGTYKIGAKKFDFNQVTVPDQEHTCAGTS